MALSAQERRCIDLALPVLADAYGGTWSIDLGPSLDELYPTEPSPECLLGNRSIQAAIEVKRLTGGEITSAYHDALRSLPKLLAPDCPGYFILGPSGALNVPVSKPIIRPLRKEIARVAPLLQPGEKGGLRMPRHAHVALEREGGTGRVHCCHNNPGDLFVGLEGRIGGSFLLVDNDLPDHDFVTDEAREHFITELVGACQRRLTGEIGENHFDWYEELPLFRGDDEEDNSDGFDVVAVSQAYDVRYEVAEGLDRILSAAIAKFDRADRWAEKHVILLDRADHASDEARVEEALSWFQNDDFGAVNLVLFTDGENVSVLRSID